MGINLATMMSPRVMNSPDIPEPVAYSGLLPVLGDPELGSTEPDTREPTHNLPDGASFFHRAQLTLLRLSSNCRCAVPRWMRATPTEDADQRAHASHFFNAQVAKDARCGFYDAEQLFFVKKTLPASVLYHLVALPLIFLFVLGTTTIVAQISFTSLLIALLVSLWLACGSYHYQSNLFYFFSSERLIIIGPTLCSAFACRGFGPFQIITTRQHNKTEYLCICRDESRAYLNFIDRESSWYSLLNPWLMHPVENGEDILKTLPELPIVLI